jgi:hypothetical protein
MVGPFGIYNLRLNSRGWVLLFFSCSSLLASPMIYHKLLYITLPTRKKFENILFFIYRLLDI